MSARFIFTRVFLPYTIGFTGVVFLLPQSTFNQLAFKWYGQMHANLHNRTFGEPTQEKE
jgi:hypothetical protein